MGNYCCKKRTGSHLELRSDPQEDTIEKPDDNQEEKSLLKSTLTPSIPPSPDNDPENQPTINDSSSHSSIEANLNEEDSPPKDNAAIEEKETKPENGLVQIHPVPMTGDRLLINELKTKFPEGLQDLKRRTRESMQNSFRRSHQKVILLPTPTQIYDSTQKHPSENLVDNLKTLEEKLRSTQKIIVNNTELSMINILEQFKLDLANTETSLHPTVIDKRREVYCKLRACFSLSGKQEKPTTLEIPEDAGKESKKTAELLNLESLNQKLNSLECRIQESEGIQKSQKDVEEILVSLENVKADHQQELILKNYLREKCLYLIKECILKNMR